MVQGLGFTVFEVCNFW